MKIVVIGATGSLGRHVVEQALAQGHHVSAFSRHPEKLGLEDPKLRLVPGDAFDIRAVAAAIAGQDAVIVTLGAGFKGEIRTAGTRNAIDGMKTHGVKRLICLSTMGAGDSRPMLNFFWKRIMFGLLLRSAYADHLEQERVVQASGLDWTLVRPAAFIDGAATGTYKHGFANSQQGLSLKISRTDVADFMLKQLEDGTYLHRTPALSY